jgi:hypothetical protein
MNATHASRGCARSPRLSPTADVRRRLGLVLAALAVAVVATACGFHVPIPSL